MKSDRLKWVKIKAKGIGYKQTYIKTYKWRYKKRIKKEKKTLCACVPGNLVSVNGD